MDDVSRRRGCECKGKNITVYTTKAYTGAGGVGTCSFNFVLVEGDLSPHMPAALPLGKAPLELV